MEVLWPQLQPHTTLHLGDGVYTARVAKTQADREKGLSGTSSLGEDQAMILAYDTDGKWPVSMKGIKYSIDIIWLDKDKKVIYIVKNARPESYPYETYVSPREPHQSLADLSPAEMDDFAAALRETLIRMENLWRMPFPYVMVLHQAPTNGVHYPGFHFHVEIHPPLRKPGLLKYLAGPEIGGGNFLNDTSPEEKAAELRAVPAVHYRQPKVNG